jgi:ADP-ribose pyrophosphatase YjhB (NUDIX family)
VPGGALDLGEAITESAVRETWEETGMRWEITGLAGLYTNPRHVIEYTSNGEVRQEFSVVFTARPVGGAPAASSESSEVLWVPATEIGRLPMHPSMRQRISHYLQRRPQPHIG